MRHTSILGLISAGLCAACGASSPSDEAGPASTSAAELRTLDPSEIVGALTYGDHAAVSYANRPTYRAWRVRADAFSMLSVRVRTTTAGKRVRAELVDDFPSSVYVSKVGTDVTLERRSTSFASYFVVVRTDDLSAADIQVDVARGGIADAIPATFSRTFTGPYTPPSALVGTSVDAVLQCWKNNVADSSAIVSLKFSANSVFITGSDGLVSDFLPAPSGWGNGASAHHDPSAFSNVRSSLELLTLSTTDARIEYLSDDTHDVIACVGHAR